jgi:anaerobic magnesium-protoporphyrin IX monomethyl ester cyclase
VEATIDHVRECRPDIFFTTVSYPIKGTPYFSKVDAKLVRIAPWARTTDREIGIRGRHSRRFYQYADELLKMEMSARPDPNAILAARNGLRNAYAEVEA